MSDVNWSLIEQVSRRFDQAVGLADEEQLKRLLVNFHLVHALMGGRMDRLMAEFVSVEPAEDCPEIDWLGVKEQLRQYNVRTDLTDPGEALRRAGIICDDDAVLHELDRLDAAGSDLPGGGPARMKLLRFDGLANFNTVETVFRSKELTPASLEHLICFAAEFPEDLPDILVGLGTLSVADRSPSRDGSAPPGGIYAPALVRDPGPGRSGQLAFQRFDRLFSPQWAAGKVFLAVRRPRSRQAAAVPATGRK